MKRCPQCAYPNPDSRDTCFKCQAVLVAEPVPAQEPPPDAEPAVVATEPEPADVDPSICAECGLPAEEGYTMGLCAACRDKLADTPLPLWTKASMVVVAAVLLFAFAQFPGSLGAGVAFERGRQAEARGEFAQAAVQYQTVVDRFPASTLALVRLGISHCKAGNLPAAAEIFAKLEGREAPQKLVEEVDQVIQETENSMRRQPRAGRQL